MGIYPIWFITDIKLVQKSFFLVSLLASFWDYFLVLNKCPTLLISTAHVLVYTCE